MDILLNVRGLPKAFYERIYKESTFTQPTLKVLIAHTIPLNKHITVSPFAHKT